MHLAIHILQHNVTANVETATKIGPHLIVLKSVCLLGFVKSYVAMYVCDIVIIKTVIKKVVGLSTLDLLYSYWQLCVFSSVVKIYCLTYYNVLGVTVTVDSSVN